MLGWSSLFSLHSSDPLKDTFLLYKRVTEQYENPEILRKVRSLIPGDITELNKVILALSPDFSVHAVVCS
jgi:hypothetical protein